jgi:N-methylhydantoinase B
MSDDSDQTASGTDTAGQSTDETGEVDALTLELVNNRLREAVQEMQAAIFRTGYSTIIRESKDTSAAIATRTGAVVTQRALHNTIHLGVFPPAVEAVYATYEAADISPGDVFVMNDPYAGASPHSPDLIVLNPVFSGGEITAWTLNVAHKPDMGGLVPGTSSGEARELYHEGIQLPPIRYERAGEPVGDIERIVRTNSRLPDLTVGDIRGQVGCTKIGKRSLKTLFDEHGTETVCACFERLLDSAEHRLRDRLNDWPATTGSAEAFMDASRNGREWQSELADDERIRLALSVERTADRIVFDFTDSDDQTDLPINMRPPLVRALCYYGTVGMLDQTLPINSGIGRVCEVRTRSGSVLDPERPAPLSSYVYPVNELTNVILRALSTFDPNTAVADASGNIGLSFGSGGEDAHVQYEIVYSGYGGTSRGDGATGTSTHSMNVEITPIEVLESEFETRIDEFSLRPDSAGAGAERGAVGLRRSYTVESPQQFTYRPKVSNVRPPQGIAGGESPTTAARCLLFRDGERRRLPTIADTVHLETGDRVVMDLPGGGGCGDPHDRDPEAVVKDYRDGLVSAERARDVYGVRIDTDAEEIAAVERE